MKETVFMLPLSVTILLVFGLLFVFITPFQNKVSHALHILTARLMEFSNAIRHLWPLALIVMAYILADRVITKIYP